ncbi:hypothetical protein, partial [Paraburkholderia phymatum]|uniref:hypothetical protein n=1 Tax=Paraburkholderia phymatum TaxID=148447 RepID=UPI001ABA10A4
DYFRYCGNPKITARSPSSTHTYRLLVFKEHSLKSCCFLASPSFGEAELCGTPRGLSSTYFACSKNFRAAA